ncbi:hypothetical protein [Embleya sp. NBC_00896]|uniref:hypothetical protein n=1 Tax=Embleya sp. NBC_00896 TaxID=2975961 RepID=UPI003869E32D|nr:hypothetical protein OG928_32210 [Embleya sp. NBC_00896]
MSETVNIAADDQSAGRPASSHEASKTSFGFQADEPVHPAGSAQVPGLPGGFGFREPEVITRAVAEARMAPTRAEPESAAAADSGKRTTVQIGFVPPVPLAGASGGARTAALGFAPPIPQRQTEKSAQSFGIRVGDEVSPRETGPNAAQHRPPLVFLPDRGFTTGFQAPSEPPRGFQMPQVPSWTPPTESVSGRYEKGVADMKGLRAAASGLPLSTPRVVGTDAGTTPAPLRGGGAPQPAVQKTGGARESGIEAAIEQSW